MEKEEVKKPATYKEQIEILESKGLIINDKEEAEKILKRINYYRFKAYTLSLISKGKFYNNVTFEKIYSLYEFDRRLRTLIMDMLENIEIAFRTHTAYTHSIKYGALGYKEYNNFYNKNFHTAMIKDIEKEVKRSKEIFIEHNCFKYKDLAFWIAIEILPFGSLSKIFRNLKPEDRKHIANTYYPGIPYSYIQSWLQVLSATRNICAHYGRLYNRDFNNPPKLHDKDKKKVPNDNKLFANIYIMKRLCPERRLWRSFLLNLQALILQYENAIKLELIGFPQNWEHVLMEW
jgi:abortive infection bacteriophage resistance protein